MSDDASKQCKKKRIVPTKLKQLAEKRARILGRLLPLGEIETELSRRVEQLTSELQLAARSLESCREQKQSLTIELQQCDEALVSLNPVFDPSKIEPIKGSKGRYGRSGMLKATVLDVIEAVNPNYISTGQIANAVISRFNLVFESNDAEYNWKYTSLKSSINKLSLSGKIEKGPKMQNAKTSPTNTWRIKIEAPVRLIDL